MDNIKLQRRARTLALQALYAQEQRSAAKNLQDFARDLLLFSWLDREASEEELFLAKTLVTGVWHNLAEIDNFIVQNLQNWTMDRLLAVDRNILRLGVYMLQYLFDTPTKVIIDECIELCHSFSSEKSYRLVNGVLHALSVKLRAKNAVD